MLGTQGKQLLAFPGPNTSRPKNQAMHEFNVTPCKYGMLKLTAEPAKIILGDIY